MIEGVVLTERLTAEDLLMLWPDKVWPQEIGALAVLDGRRLIETGGRFRIEAVQDAVQNRLHLVPRFRQLLYVPRRGLGPPLWVDAPAFDLNDHLRVAQVESPGDETQLLRTTERLRRRRLDRTRPLWEMWFLSGLPDNRIGLFVRMHHVIADGMAGIATVSAFLDTEPDSPAPSAQPWTPTVMPRARELLTDNARRRVAVLRNGLSNLVRSGTSLRRMRTTWPEMRGFFTQKPQPGTSLNRTVGPDRNLALIRSDLDTVKGVAHSNKATVNDVVLTVVAGGLSELLRSRGEAVDEVLLPTYVPVTLRHGQRDQARGNLIGQMVVPLPLGVSDPIERLHQIAADTVRQKARPHPALGTLLSSRVARWVLLKFLDRQPVNVTTADLPGPQVQAYFAGARLVEVFPLLPLIGKVPLGVGALSYSGQFNIMVVADRDACPDLDVFTAGVRAALQALERQPLQRPEAPLAEAP